MITIQNQNFGVEIELTGITRQAAAQVIADYYGTIGTRFMGTVYKTYEAVDNKGRPLEVYAGRLHHPTAPRERPCCGCQ